MRLRKPHLSLSGLLRLVRNAGLVAIVFLIGVNFGNGRIDLTPASTTTGQLPASLDYAEIDTLYRALKDNYDGKLTEQQLENGLKHGLAKATGDPYTVYFTAKEAKKFKDDLNQSFSGIGAQLGQDKDGNLEVISPIEGLPAQKAGIKARDIIVTINKENTADMSVDEAVSKIRGPAGSRVTLQIVRDRSQALDFTITRQDIQLPSLKTKVLEGNVGYIQITNFAEDTTSLLAATAADFKSKQVNAIVLDLRDNPGGLLPQSINVASFWLPGGKKILDTKKGNQVVNTDYASGNDLFAGLPTVVLVNGASASASEIVAAALRDHGAAYIIGEKTYGKGVVQQLINFGDESQLKVTVAGWYRPNGQNINNKGIKPDKTVKISEAEAEADKDPQLEAAQAHLKR